MVMRKLFCFLFVLFTYKGLAQDTVSKSKKFIPYWEAGAGVGLGVNSEFVANTENVIVPVVSVKFARHSKRFMLGAGYDAQSFTLKNTAEGMPSEKFRFGNPQHSFYLLANYVHRTGWGYFLGGISVGYSAGTAQGKADFGRYTSSKGWMGGVNLGAVYQIGGRIGVSLEVTPRVHMLRFDFINNQGKARSDNHRVTVLPVVAGLRFRI